jgi:DNA invertase Pin-like site-specific DNA recombinase
MTQTISAAAHTVAYLRTATADPVSSQLSLARQKEACESFVHSLGAQITRVYVDVGASGARARRPALAELMRDLSGGGIRRVVIADPDRLARNRQLEDRLSRRIRRYGASLASPCFKRDNN